MSVCGTHAVQQNVLDLGNNFDNYGITCIVHNIYILSTIRKHLLCLLAI